MTASRKLGQNIAPFFCQFSAHTASVGCGRPVQADQRLACWFLDTHSPVEGRSGRGKDATLFRKPKSRAAACRNGDIVWRPLMSAAFINYQNSQRGAMPRTLFAFPSGGHRTYHDAIAVISEARQPITKSGDARRGRSQFPSGGSEESGARAPHVGGWMPAHKPNARGDIGGCQKAIALSRQFQFPARGLGESGAKACQYSRTWAGVGSASMAILGKLSRYIPPSLSRQFHSMVAHNG